MQKHPVIFFDGLCNLCNGAVQFIIKRDKKEVFRFASLQSGYAKEQLRGFNIQKDKPTSIVLLEDGQVFTESTAALKIAKRLAFWSWVYVFIIVPAAIRDAVYRWIANNRYKWFGKKEKCWLPTPNVKRLFLDSTN